MIKETESAQHSSATSVNEIRLTLSLVKHSKEYQITKNEVL